MSEVDWGRYNLPAIWTLISDVDVCDGADRVLAWDGLASAVRDQHTRLLTAADNLAAVWPPGKNDSALEFQRQVKGLADSMQETLKKAEDTRAGLNGVVQAFSAAQGRVRELAAGREGVSDDWMPRFVDHAEDKYDEQAQAAMRQAEAAIQDHGSQIQPPSLFQMRPFYDDGGHHLTGDDGGSGRPSAGSSAGNGSRNVSGQSGLSASPRPVPVPVDPNSMVPPSASTPSMETAGSGGDASGTGSGPVLSGITPVQPSVNGLGGPVTSPVGTPPIGTPSPTVSTFGPGVGPGVLPIGGGAIAPGVGAFGRTPGGAGGSGARRRVPVRRGLPSGAVIGEDSERGIANARGEAGAMPMTGGPGGRGGGRSGRVTDGEADQRWETEEGVVPVISPDTTPVRHDPGPGVIGLNR
jgi:hypothetical protein